MSTSFTRRGFLGLTSAAALGAGLSACTGGGTSTGGGATQAASNNLRLFLATGVLGGFTTFSAFSLDALALWERGETGAAFAYVAASLLLSLAAIAAGYFLPRAL